MIGLALALAVSGGITNADALAYVCVDGGSRVGECNAYFAGVVEGFEWMRSKGSHLYCVPDPLSSGGAKDLFLSYLKRYPSVGERDAVSVVAASLAAQYPCHGKWNGDEKTNDGKGAHNIAG